MPELMGSRVYCNLGRNGFGFLSHCMPRGKRNMLYMARERHVNTFLKKHALFQNQVCFFYILFEMTFVSVYKK